MRDLSPLYNAIADANRAMLILHGGARGEASLRGVKCWYALSEGGTNVYRFDGYWFRNALNEVGARELEVHKEIESGKRDPL